MTDKTARGRFVWHDLMTSDPTAAHAFYGKALGWQTQAFEGNPDYKMFAASSGPLGGSGAWVGGAPHWIPYIGSTNTEEAVAKAKSLGATVTTEVTQIPNGGSYAVLKDPQGAVFGIHGSSADPGPEKAPKRGEFSWHELGAKDAKAAFNFYSSLFGWDLMGEHDMGPMGFYYLFGRNGTQTGGMFNKSADMGPPSWLGYVRVKDVNQAVKKIKSAGGALVNGPMEVPGGDWIAQLTDAQGAMFAVHVLKADLKPAAAAEPAAPAAQAAPAEPAAAPAKKAAPAARKAPAAKKAAKKPAKKKAKAKTKAKAAKRPARKAAKAKKAGKKKVVRSGGKKKSGKKARKSK